MENCKFRIKKSKLEARAFYKNFICPQGLGSSEFSRIVSDFQILEFLQKENPLSNSLNWQENIPIKICSISFCEIFFLSPHKWSKCWKKFFLLLISFKGSESRILLSKEIFHFSSWLTKFECSNQKKIFQKIWEKKKKKRDFPKNFWGFQYFQSFEFQTWSKKKNSFSH